MDEPRHVTFKSYDFSDDSPDVSSDEVGLWGRSSLPGKGSLSHAKYVVAISFTLFKYVVKCLDLLKEPQDTPYRSPISIGFPIRKMNHIQQINDYAVFTHPFLSNSIVLKCVHVSSLNRNLRHLRNPCAPCPPRISKKKQTDQNNQCWQTTFETSGWKKGWRPWIQAKHLTPKRPPPRWKLPDALSHKWKGSKMIENILHHHTIIYHIRWYMLLQSNTSRSKQCWNMLNMFERSWT